MFIKIKLLTWVLAILFIFGMSLSYIQSLLIKQELSQEIALQNEYILKHYETKTSLRQETYIKQRKIQEEIEYRKLLCLPTEGVLEESQIKSAYRKAAKSEHTDIGGSHERFVKITIARDTLLGVYDE